MRYLKFNHKNWSFFNIIYLFFKRLDIVKDKEVIFFEGVILSLRVNENFIAAVRSHQLAPLHFWSKNIVIKYQPLNYFTSGSFRNCEYFLGTLMKPMLDMKLSFIGDFSSYELALSLKLTTNLFRKPRSFTMLIKFFTKSFYKEALRLV